MLVRTHSFCSPRSLEIIPRGFSSSVLILMCVMESVSETAAAFHVVELESEKEKAGDDDDDDDFLMCRNESLVMGVWLPNEMYPDSCQCARSS
jgi:hypothetical protein